jgi:hypothetical protein
MRWFETETLLLNLVLLVVKEEHALNLKLAGLSSLLT